MLSGILNFRVLCRAFDAAREFYLRRTFGIAAKFCSRFGCEVKFCRAEFRSEAPKSRLYKILKSYFYTLKFYARRNFKFRFGGCESCGDAQNTHHLKLYDLDAEFLRDKALKFYRNAAGEIRVAEKFSKSVKFNHTKFYLVAKFYCSMKFKRLQYFKASPSSYARSRFCK